MSNYITEAFKQLNLLESEDISLDASGIEELRSFLDDAAVDPDEEMMDIYDLEAEAKEDLQKSYEGKVVLECTVCHSHIFEDKENISMDEDGEACKDIECPYCMSNEGYFIIGEIAPFDQETADSFDEEEDELDEVDIEGAADDVDDEDIIEEGFIGDINIGNGNSLNTNTNANANASVTANDNDIDIPFSLGKKGKKEPVSESRKSRRNRRSLKESCDKNLEEAWDEEFESEYDAIMDDPSLSKVERDRALSKLYSDYGINESLNESSQNKRDEFFRYCLSNDMDYELICDILVDKLDDKTLSSIIKDMEEYNDFTMDESMKLDGIKELYDNDEIRGVEELEGVDKLKGVKELHGEKHEAPINESRDKLLKEDFDDVLDAFYDEFDPDGDYENGFAAHTEDELDEWIYWCENQGVDFDYDFADEDSDRGYYAYLTINESLKSRKNKRSLKESKTSWVISSDVDGEICRVDSEREAKATIAELKREDKKKRKNKKVEYSYELQEGFGGAAIGGSIGSMVGKAMGHPVLGAVGGAIAGSTIQNSLKNNNNQSLEEDIEDVSVTTKDETMTMTTKEDGGVVIETSPKESSFEEEDFGTGEEMIVPISDESSEVIDVATDALDSEDEEDFEALKDEMEESEEEPSEDEDFEEFDEESFNGLGESYLKRCYENVKGFRTTNISSKGKNLFIEGVIKFDSGNIKETQFVFESLGKGKFEGYNKQISRGKKTYKLAGSVKNNKLVCESLNYNYRSKNELNESVRVYGTVKRK